MEGSEVARSRKRPESVPSDFSQTGSQKTKRRKTVTILDRSISSSSPTIVKLLSKPIPLPPRSSLSVASSGDTTAAGKLLKPGDDGLAPRRRQLRSQSCSSGRSGRPGRSPKLPQADSTTAQPLRSWGGATSVYFKRSPSPSPLGKRERLRGRTLSRSPGTRTYRIGLGGGEVAGRYTTRESTRIASLLHQLKFGSAIYDGVEDWRTDKRHCAELRRRLIEQCFAAGVIQQGRILPTDEEVRAFRLKGQGAAAETPSVSLPEVAGKQE